MDIKELQKHVLKFRDDRDWKQFHHPKDLAEAVSIEASEILEHFLRKSQEESHKIAMSEDVKDEFADTMNFLLLFADACGIDIEEAILSKMKKNDEKYPVEKAKGRSDKYTQL